MRALKSGNTYFAFFEDSASDEFIKNWAENNQDQLSLSEAWSCDFSLHESNGYISVIIEGDEDFKELDIVTIEPVNSF